jgi:hypothetical protein
VISIQKKDLKGEKDPLISVIDKRYISSKSKRCERINHSHPRPHLFFHLLFSPIMLDKIVLLSSLFLQFSNAQLSCSQIDNFSACVNAARLRISACSSAVVSVPNFEYYQCQCTEYTTIESCYSYCPDSPEMQLQLRTEKETQGSVCAQMDSFRKVPSSLSSVTSSRSSMGTVRDPSSTVDVRRTGTTVATVSANATPSVSSNVAPSSPVTVSSTVPVLTGAPRVPVANTGTVSSTQRGNAIIPEQTGTGGQEGTFKPRVTNGPTINVNSSSMRSEKVLPLFLYFFFFFTSGLSFCFMS